VWSKAELCSWWRQVGWSDADRRVVAGSAVLAKPIQPAQPVSAARRLIAGQAAGAAPQEYRQYPARRTAAVPVPVRRSEAVAERCERHRQPWTPDEIQKPHTLPTNGMTVLSLGQPTDCSLLP